jgi:predicted methyltransferase
MMAAPALAQISAADAVSADLAPDAGRKPAETRGLVPTGAAEQARIAIDAALADPSRPLAERIADAQRMPAEVLALLRLEPGQRILDLVAGAGYYSRLIAPVVGREGLVFAHSTEGLLTVDGLQPGWSALKRAHPNVRLILGIPGRMNLPGAIDRVLFHLAFHDLWWEDAQYRIPRMDPQAALRDVHAAMKPGGLMLVVDHRARPGAEPRGETSARHRIDPALVKAEMAKAGFMLEAESDLLASPQDDLGLLVYHPSVRGRTDRFIQLYRRP